MADKIALNPKFYGYERELASTVYRFLDQKTGSATKIKVNEVLAKELHKPVINKFKRRKVYSRFKDNTWSADLAEMGSLSSKNCGVKYLLLQQMFPSNMLGLNL